MKFYAAAGALFLSLFLAGSAAHADVHVKVRMMNGIGDSDMWTGGGKQRSVTQAPVIGEVIKISRPDKGVEWEINPSLKAYQETAIPIPYSSEDAQRTPEQIEEEKQLDAMLAKGDPAQETTECSGIVKVAETREYAGIRAEGYQGECAPKQGESRVTIWIAAGGQPLADKAQKESDAYDKAHFDSMYSHYPAAERERIRKVFEMMGKAMMQGFMGMPNTFKMPKRLLLAIESEEGEPGLMHGTMMETTLVEVVPADPSRYEVPEGFLKVENLQELLSQQMMDKMANGEMNMSDLGGALGQMAQKMGMPAEEAPSAEDPEMQEGDEFFRQTAGAVKGEMQRQGAWQAPQPQAGGQASPYGAAQPYRQAPAYGAAPRSRQQPPSDLSQNLQQVQQILGSVQGIVSQISGGSGFPGMEIPSQEESSGDDTYQEENYSEEQDSEYPQEEDPVPAES